MKLFFLISELSEKHGWYKLDYAKSFDLSYDTYKDNVPIVDGLTTSCEEFIEKYEKTYTPCIITGLQKHWMANIKWTKEVCAVLSYSLFQKKRNFSPWFFPGAQGQGHVTWGHEKFA